MSALLLHAPENQTFLTDVGKYIVELEGCIKRNAFFTAARAERLLSARDSCAFFTGCIAALESAFAADLNSYSTMRWMYYLRRLPHKVFEGKLASTAPNARALIEVYANRSVKAEPAIYGSKGFVFPVNESTLRNIARFIAFINIIYDLHVGFRLASKGCDYAFPTAPSRSPSTGSLMGALTHKPMASPVPTVLPQRVENAQVASAVQIYDQRHDSHRRTFLGAVMNQSGLAHDGSATSEDDSGLDVSCAYWGLLSEEVLISPKPFLEGHAHAAHYGDDGKIMARFGPSTLDLHRIFELYRLPAMAAVGVDTHASLCLIVLMLGGRWLQCSRYSVLRAMELGYFITKLEHWSAFGDEEYASVCTEIRAALPQFAPPEDFSAFRKSCEAFKGEVWPTAHGAPAKATNDYMCIDMWAASMGFLAWLQFPKVQGNVANTRATKFEDVVQDAIDGTRWGHSQHRSMRQRTLRIQGQNLTDIDAIGSYKDTLLIVSCKSIPYTREYDQGTHKAIRNAASTVDQGVDFWSDIVNRLTANPTGDNFDFSGYKHIIGVLCTPFAVYTSDAKALSMTVDELRWASSLDELISFLEG
ncbi:conserved protein of unknown function [Pseudomonas sp. JV551A1]|uniref:hypothetical protein n=1 Tax=Pseudomonas sp. JV551A1 TaxID=2078787 RepID=UPI00100D89C9|nr:hypothetical protein [Pseudomonas sp. JV551A1]SPO55776.1 conserved protein of unknown function [Pseudomonas sp. JV551A1]